MADSKLARAAADPDRFWSRVEVGGEDDCWEYRTKPKRGGYGQYTFGNSTAIAHRVAYFIGKGDIPEGIFVCHACDNKLCCNPKHLWLGTHKENMEDMARKGRATRNARPPIKAERNRGELNRGAKLTDELVREIRASDETYAALSRRLGVGPGTVWKARQGVSWKHVQPCPTPEEGS